MTDNKQPEALRQADYLRRWFGPDVERAAAELHRLHALTTELQAEIDRRDEQEAAIGAGGVEPLRKREQPAFYVRDADVLALADKRVAGRGAMLSKEGGAGMTAFYASAALTGETA